MSLTKVLWGCSQEAKSLRFSIHFFSRIKDSLNSKVLYNNAVLVSTVQQANQLSVGLLDSLPIEVTTGH